MNILVDSLPTAVEINGQVFEIETDFRSCLNIILAFEDPELTNFEKQLILLENIYPVKPSDLNGAIQQALKFLNGGKEEQEDVSGPRVYSFDKDAQIIFAAFKQTHGIDLTELESLHWWKFLALFMDLGSETTFSNLVSLRKRLKTGKASKEERQAAREIGELVDLPEIDTRSLEDKETETEFLRLVEEGRKKHEKNG